MITDEQLEVFREQVQALADEDRGIRADGSRYAVISIQRNRKYARVVATTRGGQDSVWGFVDLSNGNILKGESWKKPHPTPRGNIAEGTKGCSGYGPRYLTGSGFVLAQ